MRPKIGNLLDRLQSSVSKDHRKNHDSVQESGSAVAPGQLWHKLPSIMPILDPDEIQRLNQEAQDYQIVHGGLLKFVMSANSNTSTSGRVVGLSLYPSPFPRSLFYRACKLQAAFQELYVAITRDPEWLREVLADLISSDPLIRTLWSVFENTKTTGTDRPNKISAAICRSDYLIHPDETLGPQLKQVEFNTIACAGAAHGQRISDLHRHLYKTGWYHRTLESRVEDVQRNLKIEIPDNENVRGISDILEKAHRVYQQLPIPNPKEKRLTCCILMVVQPINFNIADERPIEYDLWRREPPIPCFRVEWGEGLLRSTSTTASGALLYHPPHIAETYEVSVAYLRAGFEPHEYQHPTGYEARVRIEASNAISCPNILTHLTGSKRVQQALCVTGALERFVGAEHVDILRSSFVPMYPLDKSPIGMEGRRIVNDYSTARSHVLKPNRDGGGHNIYGEDITAFLDDLDEDLWAEYVLMELINPVVSGNVMISPRGIWQGGLVAELGIWGGCIWRNNNSEIEMLENRQTGWSVRSKDPYINEVSVVKGYGCFDSIALIDEVVMQVEQK